MIGLHFPAFVGLSRFLRPADCPKVRRPGQSDLARKKRSVWRRCQRYGFIRCHWCGVAMERDEWELDHVRPLCLGGSNLLTNLVPACHACNYRRSIEQGRERIELEVEWLLAELRTALK